MLLFSQVKFICLYLETQVRYMYVYLYSHVRHVCVCVPIQASEMHHNEEFTQLLSSQQKLDFHVNRTQMWLAHLGWWKAHILHADVSQLMFFVRCLTKCNNTDTYLF